MKDVSNSFKEQLLNNAVRPETGLHIFEMAFKNKQTQLHEVTLPKNTVTEAVSVLGAII